MISFSEPKLSYCDLYLEDSNPVFVNDTLAYDDVSPYWVCLCCFGYKRFSNSDEIDFQTNIN